MLDSVWGQTKFGMGSDYGWGWVQTKAGIGSYWPIYCSQIMLINKCICKLNTDLCLGLGSD